jgi:hypothetical protein
MKKASLPNAFRGETQVFGQPTQLAARTKITVVIVHLISLSLMCHAFDSVRKNLASNQGNPQRSTPDRGIKRSIGNSKPVVTIMVYNYSNASQVIINAAEREARRLLSDAGLRVEWLNCPAGLPEDRSPAACGKALADSDLRLRVLNSPSFNVLPIHAFGFSIHPILASVFYEPILQSTKGREEFELPIILGCVMAHELGHLLLGPNHHSEMGIMQGKWNFKQFELASKGVLFFTSKQAKIIREQARKRVAAQGENQ